MTTPPTTPPDETPTTPPQNTIVNREGGLRYRTQQHGNVPRIPPDSYSTLVPPLVWVIRRMQKHKEETIDLNPITIVEHGAGYYTTPVIQAFSCEYIDSIEHFVVEPYKPLLDAVIPTNRHNIVEHSTIQELRKSPTRPQKISIMICDGPPEDRKEGWQFALETLPDVVLVHDLTMHDGKLNTSIPVGLFQTLYSDNIRSWNICSRPNKPQTLVAVHPRLMWNIRGSYIPSFPGVLDDVV